MPGKKKDFTGLSAEECDRLAFDRIARSVAACEQSSQKMRKKLGAEGYPQDSIERALEKACRIGAIDDARYADCLVRNTLASGKGLEFALKEIEELGLDPYSLESYRDYEEQGEEAKVQRAVEFLESHRPRAKDLRGACYKKLVTRGYSSNIASTASRLFCEGR